MVRSPYAAPTQRVRKLAAFLTDGAMLQRYLKSQTKESKDIDLFAREISQLKLRLRREQERAAAVETQVRLLTVSLQDAEQRERERKHAEECAKNSERWLSWEISMAGILVPALILLTMSFITTDRLAWSFIASPAGTGFFLAPIMVLSIDSVRRTFEMSGHGKLFSFVRLWELGVGGTTTLVLLLVSIDMTREHATYALGKAVLAITLWTLMAAIPASTLAVMLANRHESASAPELRSPK